MSERTFVMIKPDAVARGLVGRIVTRFEEVGLVIERMEYGRLPREVAEANYAEHDGKPFYEGLIAYVTSGPVVRMVLSGDGRRRDRAASSSARRTRPMRRPARSAATSA